MQTPGDGVGVSNTKSGYIGVNKSEVTDHTADGTTTKTSTTVKAVALAKPEEKTEPESKPVPTKAVTEEPSSPPIKSYAKDGSGPVNIPTDV